LQKIPIKDFTIDMSVSWFNLQRKFVIDTEKINRKLKKVVNYLGIDKFQFNIILVSKKRIIQINKKYRFENTATDVISFTADNEFINKNILGDIFICPEIAKKQADKYNHSLEKEIIILSIHGILHLMNFDHTTDNGEMNIIQDYLISVLELS